MILDVTVTQYHIDQGERSRYHKCPIALAIANAVGHYDVSVAHYSISIGHRVCYVPPTAFEFMQDFDRGYSVVPFKFTLELGNL